MEAQAVAPPYAYDDAVDDMSRGACMGVRGVAALALELLVSSPPPPAPL